MRENYQAKGKRYVAEGRLIVTALDGDFVTATCRGNGALHLLGHDERRGGWWCNCEARSTCSHLHALQLVTVMTS